MSIRSDVVDGAVASRFRLIALAGGPNCGKSTLFNTLTGLRQKVANYPGVTVEKKAGLCTLPDHQVVELVDLPGTYSLRPASPDEVVVRDVLLGVQPDTALPDLTLFVLDATRLERQLYVCLQVIDIGRPVLVVLNMMDAAAAEGLEIDVELMARVLGTPVVAVSARTGDGIEALREAMSRDAPLPPPLRHALPQPVQEAVDRITAMLPARGPLAEISGPHVSLALLLDEDEDDPLLRSAPLPIREQIRILRKTLAESAPEWQAHEPVGHYHAIEALLGTAVRQTRKPDRSVRDRVDRVLTHRIFGPILFVTIMGAIFQSVFAWAHPDPWT